MQVARGWGLVCLVLLVLPLPALAQFPALTNGLNYLQTMQNPDGSWGGAATALTLPLPATTTVVETFAVLNASTSPAYAKGIAWVAGQPLETTDDLSRRIALLAGGGYHLANDLALLQSYQNPDGGFGGVGGYTSSVLDSALAMIALRQAGIGATTLDPIVSSLLAVQNADGGWGVAVGEESSPYLTAWALWALQGAPKTAALSTALSKGVAYLKAQQGAGGSWGSDFETALAYLALVGLTTDTTVLGNAGNSLLSTQRADGSWDQDPYSTAMALRALKVFLEAPVTPPPTPLTGSVTGTVVDALTQVPLAGVVVSLVGNPAVQTTTNLSGAFALGGLAPGTVQLQCVLAGYVTATVTVTVTAGNIVSIGTILLSPVGSTGIIQGVVTEAGTGAPLSGVLISVTGAAALSTTTGGDGTYRFTGVPPGNVTLVASKAGYTTVSATGTVVGGGVLTFSPVLTPGPTTGTIQGMATDATTGAPLAGVTVTVTGTATLNATTGLDGTYLFTNVPPGTVTITASKSGYQTLTATGTVLAGVVLTFNPALVPTGGTPPTTGTIQGTVTDASTGSPLAGATVSVTGAATLSATTGANGTYAFPNVPPGGVTLSASKAGYTTATATGIVVAGGVLVFSPALSPAPTTGTLIGTVVDAVTNTSLAGAKIEVQGTGLSATTDVTGRFTLSNVPPGTQVVLISATGYVSQSFTLAVTAGVTYDFQTVRLTPAPTTSTATGRVTDAITGKPIVGADVTVTGTAVIGTTLSTKTDATGTYTLTGITLLEFTLKATATGYDSQAATIKTTGYGTYAVNFTLSPSQGGSLRIVSLTTDQASYPADTNVLITAIIENTGAKALQFLVAGQIENSQGVVVDMISPTSPLMVLDPLSTSTVTLTGNTYQFAPGPYRFVLKAQDPNSETVLAEAAVSFEIMPTKKAEIVKVIPSPQFTHVGATETIALSLLFVNLSNVPVQLSIQHEVKNPSGTAIHSGTQALALDPDATARTLQLGTFTYTFTANGAHPIDVKITSEGETLASATGAISVAPSIRVEPSKTVTPDKVLPDGDKRIRIEIRVQGLQE